MPDRRRKGVVLFIVLVTIILVSILCTVILRISLSQSRLSHHQISRIQAQYAARAGMVYALEMLRNNVWTYSPTNSCPNPAGCLVSDPNFPSSIVGRQFRIIFCPSGGTCNAALCSPPSGSTFCINSTTVFTYTP
ncbi:MAG: hypothetical protein WC731_02870 [Candidatus Omnitrophota bacterium]|jgi:Tfp pilus assembly protein PilX